VRPPLAVLAGLAVAVIAGAVLGEYDFEGWAIVGSGVLTGLFVGEAVIAVARKGNPVLAAASAVLSAGALLAAGWTASDHRLGTVGWKGWAAVALAGVAAGVRVGRARSTAAAPSSRSASTAPE
jgi:hypothetical protein